MNGNHLFATRAARSRRGALSPAARGASRGALLGALLLALAGSSAAQGHGEPAPPSPPRWGGPGDVVSGEAPATGPNRPAQVPTATATSSPARPPRPRPPHHLRHAPPQVAGALARYGAPVELIRQRTARSRLAYVWQAAKVVLPPGDGPTVAARVGGALPVAEAAARMAADDDRPMLVLRDCWRCGSGSESNVARKLGNEKTALLAKWFRCVRVSDGVRHPDHPLHVLFAGPVAPHLVLCAADGSERAAFHGDESLSVLWAAMQRLLRGQVDRDPERAVTAELEILSRYDHLDTMEDELARRFDAVLETLGPGAPDAAALRARLDDLARERTATATREAETMGSTWLAAATGG